MSKRVLVLGATGQIGSRVAEHLEESNFVVGRVSRTRNSLGFINWQEVMSPGFSRRFDIIVNCASPNAVEAEAQPEFFSQWMLGHGTALTNLSIAVGAQRLISLSSTRVYGEQPSGLIDEDTSLSCSSAYARGHAVLESSLGNAGRVTILRVSNSFGPSGKEGSLDRSLLTNQLVEQMSTSGKTMILSNPETEKDFLTLTDMVRALQFVIESELSGTFNVASGQSVKLGDWASLISSSVEARKCQWERILTRNTVNEKSFLISNRKLSEAGFKFNHDVPRELEDLFGQIKMKNQA